MRAGLALLVVLSAGGCFDPTLPATPFSCGAGDECPAGYTCERGLCTHGGAGGGADAPLGIDGATAGDAPLAGDGAIADARPHVDAGPPPDGCAPGTFVQCQSENVALVCSASGFDVEICEHRCNDEAGRCEQCDPTLATQCLGDDLIGCTETGEIKSRMTCPGFCLPGATARCAILKPTNLPSDLCEKPAERPRRFTADFTIDTDTCDGGRLISQQGGPSICLLEYTDLVIDPGVLVSGLGANALALAADTIAIGGGVSVSAERTRPGAGSWATGEGDTSLLFPNGGGGAGFGTAGATGGTEDVLIKVAGGPPYGAASLSPLVGGSAGGRAGQPIACPTACTTPAQGGGGGGAIQLVACEQITFGVTSQVIAVGGGGDGGFQAFGSDSSVAGGGGGGGSGGAILIESPRIEIQIAAFFAATGGGGGGGGGLEEGTRGGPGEDGQLDRPASGGGRGAPFAGRGGAGGHRDAAGVYGAPPVDGEPTQAPGYGGGGGGGAAGRVRFNLSPQNPIDPRTFIVLPYPTVGTVGAR